MGRHRTDELDGGYRASEPPSRRRARSSRGRVLVPLADRVAPWIGRLQLGEEPERLDQARINAGGEEQDGEGDGHGERVARRTIANVATSPEVSSWSSSVDWPPAGMRPAACSPMILWEQIR